MSPAQLSQQVSALLSTEGREQLIPKASTLMTFILSFKTWGRIPKKQKSKTESRSTVVYSLNHRYPKIVLKSWALFNNEYEIQKRGFLFRVAFVMHSFF